MYFIYLINWVYMGGYICLCVTNSKSDIYNFNGILNIFHGGFGSLFLINFSL